MHINLHGVGGSIKRFQLTLTFVFFYYQIWPNYVSVYLHEFKRWKQSGHPLNRHVNFQFHFQLWSQTWFFRLRRECLFNHFGLPLCFFRHWLQTGFLVIRLLIIPCFSYMPQHCSSLFFSPLFGLRFSTLKVKRKIFTYNSRKCVMDLYKSLPHTNKRSLA